MKFIDIAKLKIKAGKGGDGMIAFRRELYVCHGGPSGGDGGDGGDVIFVGDAGVNTLLELRKYQLITAEPGENGKIKNMHGKKGKNTIIKVPLGTVIYNNDNNKIIGDINKHNQEVIIARGGRGGRGNARFATASNQAPRIAENGWPGALLTVKCELKLLANVGLIGLPNAGKSTLLRAISNANAKIADYPFTTLTPQLGLVKHDNSSFVVADLPGLIAGASDGKGLGLQFLRHIERCQVLVHLIDISDDTSNHYLVYQLIKGELAKYKQEILAKPEIIVANKIDLLNDQSNLVKLQKKIKKPIYPISALQKQGLTKLLAQIKQLVLQEQTKSVTENDDNTDHIIYAYKAPTIKNPIDVKQVASDRFVVSGALVEKLTTTNPLNTHQNRLLFLLKLKDLGVYDLLTKAGVKKGDCIKIYHYEMIWEWE